MHKLDFPCSALHSQVPVSWPGLLALRKEVIHTVLYTLFILSNRFGLGYVVYSMQFIVFPKIKIKTKCSEIYEKQQGKKSMKSSRARNPRKVFSLLAA
jgi:hypothetical protein